MISLFDKKKKKKKKKKSHPLGIFSASIPNLSSLDTTQLLTYVRDYSFAQVAGWL